MIDFRKRFTGLAQAAALAGFSAMAIAQPAVSPVDPGAVERLQASLQYLAEQTHFSLLASATVEVVLEDGQKLQFDSTTLATVKRPNKFHARRLGELEDQELFYDGKTLTLQDGRLGYHASAAAPATLEGMLDFASDVLDLGAPAGDFIRTDAFTLLMQGVESALYLGPSFVEGQICDHLAFSAPETGTDWQVWIQRGETPLPRRIVITSRDILNAPQFTVHIREWDLAPEVTDALFRFDDEDESTAVEFVLVPAADSQLTNREN